MEGGASGDGTGVFISGKVMIGMNEEEDREGSESELGRGRYAMKGYLEGRADDVV